jgi:hypothetical protein
MEYHRSRARSISLVLTILVTLLATSVHAQGLFSGLPGLPSLGGILGGSAGCGEKLCPTSNLELYVGWLDGQEGSSISVDTTGRSVAGLTSVFHKYANRGVSLGLGTSLCIKDNLSLLASGWYLVPSTTHSREAYNDFAFGERTWDVNPQWWYVDGLFAWGDPCGSFKLLAGLRYDYYTLRFKNPVNAVGVNTLSTDTADASSEGWIPLLGVHYAASSSAQSLVFRVVGIPTLLGSIWYKQTANGLDRANFKGNYSGGHFLEVFAEYTKNFCGGSVGLFGKWNSTQGNGNVKFDVDRLGVPAAFADETFKLSLHRNAWTVGGVFSLNFSSPF